MLVRLSLLTALVAALFSSTAAAHTLEPRTMAQGSIDLTRDWAIQYDTSVFANTEAFCKKLRSACVSYVGPIGTYGSHHQLDCRFSLDDGTPVQTGSRPHSFCGGLAKNSDYSWTNGGEVTDYTKQVITKYFSKSAKIKGGPVSLETCNAIKKKGTFKGVTCSSGAQ